MKHEVLINEVDVQNNDNIEIDQKCQCICNYWFPRRYCIVLLLFFGLFNVYCMRANLSVAIEPMSCQFDWNSFIDGIILLEDIYQIYMVEN